MSSLVSKPPKIALIIDEVTAEVEEASRALKRLGETKIVEFKTYVRENAENTHAHLFEPLRIPSKIPEAKEGKRKRELPEHRKSWEKRLQWVDDKNKEACRRIV